MTETNSKILYPTGFERRNTGMCMIRTEDLYAVYEQLKDRYELTLTNTFALDDGFLIDCPILIGHAHGQIIQLYEQGGDFVLDILNANRTAGTHGHPMDTTAAVDEIIEFMEGRSDDELFPFPTRSVDFILDTDAGGDCDDMMAMAYLIYAQRHGYINIRAITNANACPGGPDLIRTLFEHANEPVPALGGPVGNAKNFDNYCSAVLERFGSDVREYPDAVSVLRRALADSENAVLCAIGPFNNIAALLESKPDDISPLDGVSLMREKCAKVVVMAGGFVKGEDGRNTPEWNALLDAPGTQTMVQLCPVPMVFLPFETGLDMLTGGPIMDKFGENTPLSFSYVNYADTCEIGGRHSWDPAAALYAVQHPLYWFAESPRGIVSVDDEGRTTFHEDPNGLHRYLTIRVLAGRTEAECKAEIAAYIDHCAMMIHKS